MRVLIGENELFLYDSMGMSKKKRDPVKSAKAFIAKRGAEKKTLFWEKLPVALIAGHTPHWPNACLKCCWRMSISMDWTITPYFLLVLLDLVHLSSFVLIIQPPLPLIQK